MWLSLIALLVARWIGRPAPRGPAVAATCRSPQLLAMSRTIARPRPAPRSSVVGGHPTSARDRSAPVARGQSCRRIRRYRRGLSSSVSAVRLKSNRGTEGSKGDRHVQALICLARRRVDVLWALLRDNRPFEPPRQLGSTGRNGLTNSLRSHLACEQQRHVLCFLLTRGRAGDSPQMIPVLQQIRVPRLGVGRPRLRPDRLLGDKAYSSRHAPAAPTWLAGDQGHDRGAGQSPALPSSHAVGGARPRRGALGGAGEAALPASLWSA